MYNLVVKDYKPPEVSHLVVFVPFISSLDTIEVTGLPWPILLHPLLNEIYMVVSQSTFRLVQARWEYNHILRASNKTYRARLPRRRALFSDGYLLK